MDTTRARAASRGFAGAREGRRASARSSVPTAESSDLHKRHQSNASINSTQLAHGSAGGSRRTQSVKALAVPRRRPAGVRRERFRLQGELRRVRLVCSRSPCVNVCSAFVHLPRVGRWRRPRRILSISKPITPSFQPSRYAHARNERGESVCTVQQCARRESCQSTASLCTLRLPCACAMQTSRCITCTSDVACYYLHR